MPRKRERQLMASDIFIKIGDIKGESEDAAHKGEIKVLSWSWGSTQVGTAGTGGGAGSGRVQVEDLVFTKAADSSSPVLLGMCNSGKHVDSAVLTVRKAGGNPLEYIKITMKDCAVTRHTHGCETDAEQHTETVNVNFRHVKYEYTPQKADGSGGAVITTEWDIAANK
jgi:type VI secretion system secreted protein Hcp